MAVCGNLAGFGVVPAQRRRRQEDVCQSGDPGHAVIQQDGDTAPQAHCDQDVLTGPHPQIGYAHDDLSVAHSGRR